MSLFTFIAEIILFLFPTRMTIMMTQITKKSIMPTATPTRMPRLLLLPTFSVGPRFAVLGIAGGSDGAAVEGSVVLSVEASVESSVEGSVESSVGGAEVGLLYTSNTR